MKVYVVTMDWHYETHLTSVHVTEESAKLQIEEFKKTPPNDGSTQRFDITEMELNS